jgi:uncharacterized repeat protein (TIGR03803 family)
LYEAAGAADAMELWVLHGRFAIRSSFKVNARGKETLVHSFAMADGDTPWAGLIKDGAGNLYGSAAAGGAFNFGTVFKIKP